FGQQRPQQLRGHDAYEAMGHSAPTRACAGIPGPVDRTPVKALARSGSVPAVYVAYPGPVTAYAGPARLRPAGAYPHAAVLDPVRVGRRSRSAPVCGRAAAWPRHDGAARQNGPDAFRAVE